MMPTLESRIRPQRASLVLVVAIWALVQPAGLCTTGDVTSFDHGTLDELLHDFVDDEGYVDYTGLAGRRAELRSYLDALVQAPLERLGRDERLALLINAYNAFTLELILEEAPKQSIRDIPAERRWKAVRWRLGGKTYSLNQIEHEAIRPRFGEPRVHFALVCAALSCPPLRREAYTGERLEAQLGDQARQVNHGERWLRYDPGENSLGLTRLYEWYRGDFEQVAGTIVSYVARYRDDLDPDDPPDIWFMEYDWSLNDRSRREEDKD